MKEQKASETDPQSQRNNFFLLLDSAKQQCEEANHKHQFYVSGSSCLVRLLGRQFNQPPLPTDFRSVGRMTLAFLGILGSVIIVIECSILGYYA